MQKTFLGSWPLMMAVVLTVSGCGGSASDGLPRQAISGTVTLDGQPMVGGAVTFIPDGFEGPGVGSPIQDGAYSLSAQDGPVPGRYRVAIYRQMPTGKTIQDPDDTSVVFEEKFETIPEIYNVRTELKAEVKAGGSNHFPFDLKGEIKTPPPPTTKKRALRRN
ncbi:MAG: hypothetical protein ABS79_01745 [Planctomycetes bacterium SCN 63-9]|nr:MAG: hypothetical protein ABS79_01745 [Planctomycetes bacterium SCN 63-9]